MYGTGGEMDGPASKFRSTARPPKVYATLSDEKAIPPFVIVGAVVKAVGYYAGSHKLFSAKVVAIRDKFPRIVVQLISDEDGNTLPLCRPDPKTAYVIGGMVEPV
jgi:hypothetical protein